MYSSFTVKLIDEVRKRKILYNTRFEKRPKTEKEAQWEEIAQILSCDKEKCKKLWKNLRDRYVKVLNARQRHFANNGRELEAPNYIYFSNLQFLNEAPLNKMDCCDDETSYTILLDDFEPTLLISKNIDYTIKFIQLVQNNSIPCDEKLFKNLKYIQEFKAIKKELNASFSASSLREYWISLIKKYKRWNENRHHLAPIMNEDVFKEMSHNCDVIENDTEVIEEEHIEEIDIETIESYEDDIEPQEEPSPKRARLTIQQLVEDNNKDNKTEDEYDFFAKKVALQLRQIAQKNLLVARKAEIEVLKLLMEHESIV